MAISRYLLVESDLHTHVPEGQDRLQQRGYVPSVVEDAVQHGTNTPSYGGASSYYSPSNNITVIVDDATGRVVTVRGGK